MQTCMHTCSAPPCIKKYEALRQRSNSASPQHQIVLAKVLQCVVQPLRALRVRLSCPPNDARRLLHSQVLPCRGGAGM